MWECFKHKGTRKNAMIAIGIEDGIPTRMTTVPVTKEAEVFTILEQDYEVPISLQGSFEETVPPVAIDVCGVDQVTWFDGESMDFLPLAG